MLTPNFKKMTMHSYRHYSFDLWYTLIKTNPKNSFKHERAKHIHQKYGKNLEYLEVYRIIREVEKWGDAINQMNGKCISPLEMYAMIIFKIQGHLGGISTLDMEILYKELEIMFLEHHPVIYDENTIAVLDELIARGKTLSLLCNTGFIRGKTLDMLLEKLGIRDKFLFRIYSDEVGLSKPNREIFRLVNKELPYDTEDIIHIGDNPIADGVGAQEYGFGHMIINSNSYTIKDIL